MQLHRSILCAAALGSPIFAANLEITITPVFNGEPLRLDSLNYPNAAGETLSLTRLSYLLDGFALEEEDGQWIELAGTTAWMDAAARRNTILLEKIPEGKYRALRFHVGPNAALNTADVSKIPASHPLNPNVNGLHWSWQSGYIFMAIEGHYRTENSELQGYSLHLARDPNRTRVDLSATLALNHDARILLHLDLATLFNAPRPISLDINGSSTHSREGDPISTSLVANLPGAFRVSRVVSTTPSVRRLTTAAPIDLPEDFTPYRFTMNRSFPMPQLPTDNPLIQERITLGEKLFSDKTLSRDGSISCSTCHLADAAFTDRLPVSRGIGGALGNRNAMPLFNLAWKRDFFWDGRVGSLREQVLMPIEDHREMGASIESVSKNLNESAVYQPLFRAAFGSPGVTAKKISLALEQFILTLSARDSRFDRAMAGKATLSEQEQRGFELFMTESEPRTGQSGADCFHCHGGALFSDHQFHNNGLAGIDHSRSKVTGLSSDAGKFATPSLRNIALTAPYMHDGRFTTLEEVVEHYSAGINRSPTLDPNLAKHPGSGLNLPTADKAALVAFLKTLTDEKRPTP